MRVTPRELWAIYSGKAKAYRLTFQLNQPANIEVLEDLAIVCHAAEPTFVEGDPYKTAYREGQRSVWIRIQRMLRLTDDQIFAIYSGNQPKPTEGS